MWEPLGEQADNHHHKLEVLYIRKILISYSWKKKHIIALYITVHYNPGKLLLFQFIMADKMRHLTDH